MRALLYFLLAASFAPMAGAAEQAFPMTETGVKEIKLLPRMRWIATQSERHYFDASDRLFRPLFDYIRKRDIAMTTPVEAEMAPGRMVFFIGADAADQPLEATGAVSAGERPAKTVASIGARGGYNRANFREAANALREWLDAHPEYEAAAEPRGVFWNGPFTPWFLKRFEVHIDVKRLETAEDGAGSRKK